MCIVAGVVCVLYCDGHHQCVVGASLCVVPVVVGRDVRCGFVSNFARLSLLLELL